MADSIHSADKPRKGIMQAPERPEALPRTSQELPPIGIMSGGPLQPQATSEAESPRRSIMTPIHKPEAAPASEPTGGIMSRSAQPEADSDNQSPDIMSKPQQG